MGKDSIEETTSTPLTEAFEDEVITMYKEIGGVTIIGSPERVKDLTQEDLDEMLSYENLPPKFQV